MAALAHPHVVTIYDCGEVQGRHFLVMEYLEGSTLRTRMQPGQPMPPVETGPVLDAIAQAPGSTTPLTQAEIDQINAELAYLASVRPGTVTSSTYTLSTCPDAGSEGGTDGGVDGGGG